MVSFSTSRLLKSRLFNVKFHLSRKFLCLISRFYVRSRFVKSRHYCISQSPALEQAKKDPHLFFSDGRRRIDMVLAYEDYEHSHSRLKTGRTTSSMHSGPDEDSAEFKRLENLSVVSITVLPD